MRKIEDVYLNKLEELLKEDACKSAKKNDYGSLLNQTGKLTAWGKLMYYVQKDEYELVSWPFPIHFYPKKEELSAQKFMRLIHPDDCLLITRGKLKALNLLKSMTSKELLNHKVEFHCRIKNLKSDYQTMFFRCIGLDVDFEGDLKHIYIEVLPLATKNETSSGCGFQLTNMDTKECVLKLGRNFFPAKRLEILKLIDKGLSSEEITELLTISVDTLYQQRKKLLKQTGCKKIQGVIHIAREMGLINE